MAGNEEFNLFVYGTLMSPDVFRAVTGRRFVRHLGQTDGATSFRAREAVLEGYRKVSFDGTYEYAVPYELGAIEGYVIGPLPCDLMAVLTRYEGRNYIGRIVRVRVRGEELTDQGEGNTEIAVAFVGNMERLQGHAGWVGCGVLRRKPHAAEKPEGDEGYCGC